MESNRQRDPETLRPRDPPEPFNDARVTVALAEITNPPATGPRTSLHSSNSGSAGTWSNEERSESNDIELPEIDTDEEDGGSAKPGKKVFVPPDWANTPELRQALEDQMCVDHEEIFGPIQPVDLAKMFKDKRLRRRGSSGNWERDCLTEVEIEQDRLAREKIREDGAWSYEAIQDLHKGDERAFGR